MDIRVYREKQRADDANMSLVKMKSRLKNLMASFEDQKLPQYTGWFVLLREDAKAPSGYQFAGFFDSDTANEEDEPQWDFAIPIKVKEDIEEFNGW